MPDVFVDVDVREQITDLPADLADRVRDRLKAAGENPTHYLNSLTGSDRFAVRIGDYRAIVRWDRDEDALYVVGFGHRRNVYDREL